MGAWSCWNNWPQQKLSNFRPNKQGAVADRPASGRSPCLKTVASLNEVRPVTVEPVLPEERAVWDVTMAEYHALGSGTCYRAAILSLRWARRQAGGGWIGGTIKKELCGRSSSIRWSATGGSPSWRKNRPENSGQKRKSISSD